MPKSFYETFIASNFLLAYCIAWYFQPSIRLCGLDFFTVWCYFILRHAFLPTNMCIMDLPFVFQLFLRCEMIMVVKRWWGAYACRYTTVVDTNFLGSQPFDNSLISLFLVSNPSSYSIVMGIYSKFRIPTDTFWEGHKTMFSTH